MLELQSCLRPSTVIKGEGHDLSLFRIRFCPYFVSSFSGLKPAQFCSKVFTLSATYLQY